MKALLADMQSKKLLIVSAGDIGMLDDTGIFPMSLTLEGQEPLYKGNWLFHKLRAERPCGIEYVNEQTVVQVMLPA